MQLTIIHLFIIIGLKSKPKVAETTENESQYSGHSTSSLRKDQVHLSCGNPGIPAWIRAPNAGSIAPMLKA